MAISRLRGRLRSLRQLCWLMAASGSPVSSFRFLRRMGPPQPIEFRYANARVSARRNDWPAICEVFIEDEYGFLPSVLDSDDTPRILDLGANIGTFAIRLFARWPDASIHSVEAAPDTFEILSANEKLNPERKWTTQNCAVWDRRERLSIVRGTNSASNKTSVMSATQENDRVEAIPLSDILDATGWDRIDLVKIDIEGAERQAVPSALAALRRVDSLLIEIHGDTDEYRKVTSALFSEFPNRYILTGRQSSKPLYYLSRKPAPSGAGMLQPIRSNEPFRQ